MATTNPFDLLGDDDNDDPSQLLAAQQQKVVQKKDSAPAAAANALQQKPAKLPTKPLPPAQSVKEASNEAGRGSGRGGGRGFGRGRGYGRGGFNRDSGNNENSFSSSAVSGGQGAPEDVDDGKSSERRGGYGGPRPYRGGGRRGGFGNGEVGEGERPRRVFERRSGTGRGNGLKREGSGRGNWGTQADDLAPGTEEVNVGEKSLGAEKLSGEEDATEENKENPETEPEEKEPEDKEMTLEEYEKVLEEKRKALQALKTEERKVDVKEFKSMQQLSSKKENNDVFIKLGADKDKKKELAEKEEKAKKSVSINEFLKPAEGERYHGGGRGRGRGRGSRGGFSGGGSFGNVVAPSIEDPGQFPSLVAK